MSYLYDAGFASRVPGHACTKSPAGVEYALKRPAGRTIENQPSLFASLWRFKFLIAGAAVAAALVAYGLSVTMTPVYESSGLMLLSEPTAGTGIGSDLSLFRDPGRYIRNQVAVIQSPVVITRAAENLDGRATPDDIRDSLTVTPESDLDAVSVSSTTTDAQLSSDVVNAVVQAYGEVVSETVQENTKQTTDKLEVSRQEQTAQLDELDRQLAENPDDSAVAAERRAVSDSIYDLKSQIDDLTANALLYGTGIQLYIEPRGPGTQIAPRPARNAAIALVLGALAAGAFAWWRAEQDQRADTKDVPAAILDAPLLAVVPEFESVKAWAPAPTVTHVDTPAAEAFNFALSSLNFVLEETGGSSVVITSPDPSDGKTVVALNLAVAAMKDGRSPLLIDGDERARGLTKLAGLEGEASTNGAVGKGHVWPITPNESLDFIASGRDLHDDISGHFRSVEFRKGLQSVMTARDLVIIDAPPVMLASETADLAAEVDGVVMVIRENAPLRDIADARDRILLSGTPIVGYVYNRATSQSGGYYYGRYGRHYGGAGD